MKSKASSTRSFGWMRVLEPDFGWIARDVAI
jgi:hypothetical protein